MKTETVSLITIAALTIVGACILILVALATRTAATNNATRQEMHEWCTLNPKVKPIEVCERLALKLEENPAECHDLPKQELAFLKQSCIENN